MNKEQLIEAFNLYDKESKNSKVEVKASDNTIEVYQEFDRQLVKLSPEVLLNCINKVLKDNNNE